MPTAIPNAARLDQPFLGAADVAIELLGHHSVRSGWAQPSALARMTIGALACHLGRQVTRVAELAGVRSDDDPIDAREHYRRAAWVTAASLDDPSMDRTTDEDEAAMGYEALLSRVIVNRRTVKQLLTSGDAAEVVAVPWQGWSLRRDQFLLTRLVEIIVHTDDLAASLDEPTPEFSADAFEPVAHLLSELAVRRHGQAAVIRTFTRAERAPGEVNVF